MDQGPWELLESDGNILDCGYIKTAYIHISKVPKVYTCNGWSLMNINYTPMDLIRRYLEQLFRVANQYLLIYPRAVYNWYLSIKEFII